MLEIQMIQTGTIIQASEKYEILEKIGEGAYGRVWRARRLSDNKLFAIKTAQTSDPQNQAPYSTVIFNQIVETLRREISFLRQIDPSRAMQSHILPLIEAAEHEQLPVMILPLCQHSLVHIFEKHIQKGTPPFDWRTLFNWIEQIALALKTLHGIKSKSGKIILRDLKLDNILIKDHNIYLSDFGTLKIINREHTFSIAGTVLWGAPEMFIPMRTSKAGEPLYGLMPKSDLYALGLVIYALLTADYPQAQKKLTPLLASDGKPIPGSEKYFGEIGGLTEDEVEKLEQKLHGLFESGFKNSHQTVRFPLPNAQESVKTFRSLVQDLLSRKPEERPEAIEVVKRIKALRKYQDPTLEEFNFAIKNKIVPGSPYQLVISTKGSGLPEHGRWINTEIDSVPKSPLSIVHRENEWELHMPGIDEPGRYVIRIFAIIHGKTVEFKKTIDITANAEHHWNKQQYAEALIKDPDNEEWLTALDKRARRKRKFRKEYLEILERVRKVHPHNIGLNYRYWELKRKIDEKPLLKKATFLFNNFWTKSNLKFSKNAKLLIPVLSAIVLIAFVTIANEALLQESDNEEKRPGISESGVVDVESAFPGPKAPSVRDYPIEDPPSSREEPRAPGTKKILDSIPPQNSLRSEKITTDYRYELSFPKEMDNDFHDNGDGTITDFSTLLMWQRSGSERYMGERNAIRYIQKINKEAFAGHDDWRLPTISELGTLVEMNNQGSNEMFIAPIFDTTQWVCWSSDLTTEGERWFVSFKSGNFGESNKNSAMYVRAVRQIPHGSKHQALADVNDQADIVASPEIKIETSGLHKRLIDMIAGKKWDQAQSLIENNKDELAGGSDVTPDQQIDSIIKFFDYIKSGEDWIRQENLSFKMIQDAENDFRIAKIAADGLSEKGLDVIDLVSEKMDALLEAKRVATGETFDGILKAVENGAWEEAKQSLEKHMSAFEQHLDEDRRQLAILLKNYYDQIEIGDEFIALSPQSLDDIETAEFRYKSARDLETQLPQNLSKHSLARQKIETAAMIRQELFEKSLLSHGSATKPPKELSIRNRPLRSDAIDKLVNTDRLVANDFRDNKDGTVTDLEVELMWQKAGSKKELNFEEAKQYIEQLNENGFPKHDDWRLPTTAELWTLVENEQKGEEGLYLHPVFDHKQWRLWSCDVNTSGWVWNLYFSNKSIQCYHYDNSLFVRAVRSETTAR
jgi:serine/threonine protein kinase